MRALVPVALLALLLAPAALAQVGTGGTLANPVRGSYYETYVITGRAIDSTGGPVSRGTLTVALEMPGVNAAPLDAGTDCFGTFITYFTLHKVDPRGKVTVTLKGMDGQPAASAEARLDPFFRRSDVNLTLPSDWTLPACEEQEPLWTKRVTITGRMLTRTEPYVVEKIEHHAQPVPGHVRLRYWRAPGSFECPPARTEQSGDCEPILIDERGDFRYSWVFVEEQEPVGHVEVIFRNGSWNFSIDPKFRYALGLVETTGRGAPPIVLETPAPAAPMALAAVALAALAAARLLPGKRGRR